MTTTGATGMAGEAKTGGGAMNCRRLAEGLDSGTGLSVDTSGVSAS